MSNKLEQLEFKWKKLLGFRNMQENLKNFEITRAIYSKNKFWKLNAFSTCSWRFLMSNKLEQLEFKMEKLFGI